MRPDRRERVRRSASASATSKPIAKAATKSAPFCAEGLAGLDIASPETHATLYWAAAPLFSVQYGPVPGRLAHAYHDQVLGFDDARVLKAFRAARAAKPYEDVLAHTGRRVRHYALTNHKEYFAEATEAYLYRNDFYPFVAAELKEHDPKAFAVMKKIWGPAAVR
mgnify:CR=1 FL=1